jgi:hypothetical protein
MRGRMRWPWILGGLFAVALGMPVEGMGGTIALAVRWQPSADANVAGYRVYARRGRGKLASAVDAGMPARAADGSMSTILTGVDPTVDHGYAVTAYTADGTESAFSNELAWSRPKPCADDADCADDDACTENERCRQGRCLRDPVACPAAGPCEPASCDPQAGCTTIRTPDGGTCYDNDPCVIGSCTGTTCVTRSERHGVNHDLALSSFGVHRLSRRRQRLRARGSFVTLDPVDPRSTGATLELHDAAGTMVYHASVPGSAFRARAGQRFTATGRRGARSVAGVRRLAFTLDGDHAVWVSVDAIAADVLRPAASTQLVWLVRLGDTCVRAMGLLCDPAHGDGCL